MERFDIGTDTARPGMELGSTLDSIYNSSTLPMNPNSSNGKSSQQSSFYGAFGGGNDILEPSKDFWGNAPQMQNQNNLKIFGNPDDPLFPPDHSVFVGLDAGSGLRSNYPSAIKPVKGLSVVGTGILSDSTTPEMCDNYDHYTNSHNVSNAQLPLHSHARDESLFGSGAMFGRGGARPLESSSSALFDSFLDKNRHTSLAGNVTVSSDVEQFLAHISHNSVGGLSVVRSQPDLPQLLDGGASLLGFERPASTPLPPVSNPWPAVSGSSTNSIPPKHSALGGASGMSDLSLSSAVGSELNANSKEYVLGGGGGGGGDLSSGWLAVTGAVPLEADYWRQGGGRQNAVVANSNSGRLRPSVSSGDLKTSTAGSLMSAVSNGAFESHLQLGGLSQTAATGSLLFTPAPASSQQPAQHFYLGGSTLGAMGSSSSMSPTSNSLLGSSGAGRAAIGAAIMAVASPSSPPPQPQMVSSQSLQQQPGSGPSALGTGLTAMTKTTSTSAVAATPFRVGSSGSSNPSTGNTTSALILQEDASVESTISNCCRDILSEAAGRSLKAVGKMRTAVTTFLI
jgi:hypothetical protein